MPRGIVALIMGHAPNATAARRYINCPLELLTVRQGKHEAWILDQAGIKFQQAQPGLKLRIVAATSLARA